MISIPRIEKIARGDKSVTPRDAVEKKFAEQGGGYDPYIIEITATMEEGKAEEPNFSTDAIFEDAKAQFLANKPVLMRLSVAISPIQTLTYISQVSMLSDRSDMAALTAIMERNSAINFLSDGSITTGSP